ncbi:hypothetical protein BOTBODRAFT_29923 [Botryobasidium botryosum FD-172 SS1]|uniref:Autophagy-related protein 17 n=1 Tax=Botryobasidium botryosum (strain FD-172 SS1) TaxID=930990 RepID=A0A067MSU4_BOTB1|nr:hypothetical protein BOTBODRAFT_29923 [Botryobasidium botryosum FD-172 SS1]
MVLAEANGAPLLFSLVVQAKKALQHAESLCSLARGIEHTSARSAVDVLSLEAKVKWVTEGVLDQLKLATTMSKHITQERSKLMDDVKEWDSQRTIRNNKLDSILETLGAHLVPPSLHQLSSGSSLFGSQIMDRSDSRAEEELPKKEDKSKWKSLRDFVDERGIEEAVEKMEEDRSVLEDLMATTSTHPLTLNKHITLVRSTLPPPLVLNPSVEAELSEQDSVSSDMALHLESIANHYGQLTNALRDEEAGEVLHEDDMQVFIRDSGELAAVIPELEDAVALIEIINDRLVTARQTAQDNLDKLYDVMSLLEELGDMAVMMVEDQRQVESDAISILTTLREHLVRLEELEGTYTGYQRAYNKLILEMDRRRAYRDTVDALVQSMAMQLQNLRDDEIAQRERFLAEEEHYLPPDLCPFVGDAPVVWTLHSDGEDELPDLTASIVLDAQRDVERTQITNGLR